ncbi:MAG: sigma-54 factor interaction domain-containing protein, partial [bacterium]|nr:sigma-54 factor interaction domain-containing protein [bacterium]
RGAFTGAIEARPGRFREARGGTVFLDEIGDMPLELQAKLLRVLQSGEVTSVGGRHPEQVDARILAATNRDLIRRQLAFPSERQLERPGEGVLAGLLFRVSDN